MKNIIFAAAMLTSISAAAQANKTATGDKSLKEVLTLTIPTAGGANAASVAWHPVNKKYYAAQAGNVDYPMVVFDAKGKQASNNELKTMFDVRGLWYNPNTKTLQMNGYNDFGWAEYKLDAKGIPVSVKDITKGMNQPDEQSVGAYDYKKNRVYFFTAGGLAIYNMNGSSTDSTITLHLGVKKKEDINEFAEDERKQNYNGTTAIYTGLTGSEVGLLNYSDRQIELYNIATGLLVKELPLPADAPCEDRLNFSYSNGIYWLNDTKARIWHGYAYK